MLIRLKLIVLSTLLFLSLSLSDYQERNVYYSQSDNACHNGKDIIRLMINLDDQDRAKYEFDTLTSCSQWSFRYASSIYVMGSIGWTDREMRKTITEIWVLQESTKKYTFGILSALIVKATIKNPVLINQVNYNCTIFGDGTVQHFGIYFDTPPAEIYMRCISITQEQADKLREERKKLAIDQQ